MRPGLRPAGLAGLACAALLCAGSALATDINQASEADLDGLAGLGPATTRLILAERAKAPFRNWQDLLARVKGLGPGNAARLSEQGLTVAGQPFTRSSDRRP